MANTHEVLEGVKDYTLELLGTKARDEAVDAADRAEAQAERAESAADNAEVGIRDDTVTKQNLTPGLRDELDGKADEGHTHASADITDTVWTPGDGSAGDRVIRTSSTGRMYYNRSATAWNEVANREYVLAEVGKKADAEHTHTAADVGAREASWTPTAQDVGARPADWVPTAAQVGARPDTWTPTAAEVGAATPGYVDSRIQEVTADQWPSNPQPGVIYWQAED